jgi:hypothetical protein
LVVFGHWNNLFVFSSCQIAAREAGGGRDRNKKGEEDTEKQSCGRISKERDRVTDKQRDEKA